MIELESVAFRNFLSYGDYVTEVKLDRLQQCLITGETSSDGMRQFDETDRSNGAGKSVLINAILWVLFGRTMYSPGDSGDNILNWFTDGDTWGELKFKGGDVISRTRTRSGRTELVYVRDGDHNRITSDTLATTKIQQARLNREFGLDWDIFCGSACFTQYNRPWMEMPEQARKQAIERMLHVDRCSVYAQVAAEKVQKLDQQRSNGRLRIETLEADISRLSGEVEETRLASAGFEQDRDRRKQAALQRAAAAAAQRDALTLPDLADLAKKWSIVAQVRARVKAMRDEARRLSNLVAAAGHNRDSCARRALDQRGRIKKWQDREGKDCPQCEQKVPHDHVASRVEPLQEELQAILAEQERILAELEQLKAQESATATGADRVEQALQARLPGHTEQEARLLHREWKQYDDEFNRHLADAELVQQEVSLHDQQTERLLARLEKLSGEVQQLRADIDRYALLSRHWSYVSRAYADRKKVKSFAVAEHIPYMNDRLAYYLQVLNLDLTIQFNSSLGVDNSKWGYNYYSGGERKRTDLAIMFAMFDLHEKMYDRQCNVIVLDEVDGRLDGAGLEGLIQIVKNDLVSKAETILIISHRRNMFDVFPHHIHIRKTGWFSQLSEVR